MIETSRALLIAVAVLIAACGSPPPPNPEPSQAPPAAIPLPAPPAIEYPGNPWIGPAGRVSSFVISLSTIQCFDPQIELLTLGWPPGTPATDDSHARQFVRDPTNSYRGRTMADFEGNVVPPADLVSTGLRNGLLELGICPSTADTRVYVWREGGVFEPWPRVTEFFACV